MNVGTRTTLSVSMFAASAASPIRRKIVRRLALAASSAILLAAGAASANTIFQDGDFANYAGPDYTTWTCPPAAAGTTPGQWLWKGNEAGHYYFGSPEATGGNPDAWLHALLFTDERAMVGLPAAASGTTWDISFDYIAQGDILNLAPVLHVLGYTAGQQQSRGSGSAINGVSIGDITTSASNTWTTATGSVTINGNYSCILLMFSAAAGAVSTVGFDNIIVSNNTSHWTVDGGGTWNSPISWTNFAIPTGAGTGHASFTGNLVTPASATVTLDSNQSVAGLTFDNAAHSYTIAQGTSGMLTLGDGIVTATIDVNSGTHTISAPVALASNTTITVAASSALNMTGDLTISGGKNVTKAGDGTLTIAGAQTWNAGSVLNATGGTTNLNSDVGVNVDVSVSNSATVNFGGAPHVKSLTLTNGHATINETDIFGHRTLFTNALTLTGTSTINIKNNDILVKGGNFSTIRSAIADGEIFTNSTVGLVAKARGVGYVAGDDATFWHGGLSFEAGDVLIKYTYVGDANLDGSTDGSDVALWAQNFTGALGVNPPNPRVWTQGDWNYDGSVDGSDVALWSQNFTGAFASFGPAISVEVPEPASLGLAALGALGLLARRRRVG